MAEIAKTHGPGAPWDSLIPRLRREIARLGAHPGRVVVLLPFSHLLPVARRHWADAVIDGFAPRFETTRTWAQGLGAFQPAADDISLDPARDMLSAQSLLERSALRARRDLLAGRLMEAARQLAAVAASMAPADRPAWAASARALLTSGLDNALLRMESAVAMLALEWAAASAYESDGLFADGVIESLDALIVLEGFQADPLARNLARRAGDRAVLHSLSQPASRGQVRFHPARNAEDEAQRAAACVLRHLQAGRVPVALAATDRVLTRRIRAMLAQQGIAMRDETGWTLSTTRSAAHLFGALRACAWSASADAVLDWLKNAPVFDPAALQTLEQELRRDGLRDWRAGLGQDPAAAALASQAQALREGMQAPRPLAQWLAALQALLQAGTQWDWLGADAAGAKVLAVLHLEPQRQAALAQSLKGSTAGTRRWTLSEFSAWVSTILEAHSFTPEPPSGAVVAILPFGQTLGRAFAAMVLPGCDEIRLNAAPEPEGAWTPAQRQGLGLPAREALQGALQGAWAAALQTPHCDVLWRRSDGGGEPLLPSPLVQLLLLDNASGGGDEPGGEEPRVRREMPARPTARPAPSGQTLPLARLSASAYEDLRRCPYRFFALRQLRLQEADELDAEVDKRDFGLWLHAVLTAFHQAQQRAPESEPAARSRSLDAAADAAQRSMGLSESEFLPFAAAWPRVRDGYLEWLRGHEAGGAHFESAEQAHELPLADCGFGDLRLIGRIDRVDRLGDGGAMVMDYKTEALTRTRQRIRRPLEDTQLAFYAALLGEEPLRAVYVNVAEREGTHGVEQEGVIATRDTLLAGVRSDMTRIAQGAPLPALGEGSVCDYCAARGLCRKDFWEDA
ncbi:MAG: PD-(D/E)XK nuclease family protein [Burkholderiaceae bacterium]|nr:PD-(D/E)XK nuclease family protein [Burkholderiaceae bacterium]MDO9089417.1 PD-(D/E)XK nuclease family protein [Burkholderiaceae bacterium]